jgi:primosomal protein N' (replication factor Y)
MDFYDVVFPVNLGPLTYGCDQALSSILKPGMMVSAQLKNKNMKGIVLGKSMSAPIQKAKVIRKVYGEEPILSKNMITLLTWMSEYYIVHHGLALKNMLPREAFTGVRKRASKKKVLHEFETDLLEIEKHDVEKVMDVMESKTYATFLIHAPSTLYEYSFFIKILSDTENAIILAPELSNIQTVYSLLKKHFGERICLLHGDLNRGQRFEAIESIRTGKADIVLGTRSAIFAPLRRVSLIAVLNEQSPSYKQENSPCYNGRDVAVMRGFIEKTPVLLTSVCPSIESFHNSRTGKYVLIKPKEQDQKPKIRIIDMRFEKLAKPYISQRIINASRKYIEGQKKILFVVNRRGYATLLLCKECGFTEECSVCRIPLVFHKQHKVLKCHYCGSSSKPPSICKKCGSHQMEMLGYGTQRVQEDMEALLEMKTLRVDSDKTRKRSEADHSIGMVLENSARVIVGTKLMTGKLRPSSGYMMGAFLNPDLSLNIPDFRSAERMFQEIISIADKIEPAGELFIQTRMPQEPLYKYVKNYSYSLFCKEELQKRKVLRYPPYARLLLIRFQSSKDISEEILEKLSGVDEGVQILGPACSRHPRGKYMAKLLLKSSVRGALHATARKIRAAFQEKRDVAIRFDMDPLSV